MKQNNEGRRFCIMFFSVSLMLAFFFMLSLSTGSVKISFPDVLRTLFFDGENAKYRNIIFRIRFPRTFMSVIVGGALALSGYLLQTYFQNPIAGPFVLGISSGSKMMICVALIFCSYFGLKFSSALMIVSSFLGACVSTLFILIVARRVNRMASLLVAGIMAGYITSAVSDFLVVFAEDSDIVNLHNWSQGSFSGASMNNCYTAFIVVLLCLICVTGSSKTISAYQLGEDYARSMGINTKIFRPLLIIFSSVLSSCSVAFAGPVSFIGIAVPFVVKSILRTSKPLLLIPTIFLGGSFFCLLSDFIARNLFAPMELNVSIITSFFGSPLVIFMMLKKRSGE